MLHGVQIHPVEFVACDVVADWRLVVAQVHALPRPADDHVGILYFFFGHAVRSQAARKQLDVCRDEDRIDSLSGHYELVARLLVDAESLLVEYAVEVSTVLLDDVRLRVASSQQLRARNHRLSLDFCFVIASGHVGHVGSLRKHYCHVPRNLVGVYLSELLRK